MTSSDVDPTKLFLNHCLQSSSTWGVTGAVGKVALNVRGKFAVGGEYSLVVNTVWGSLTFNLLGAECTKFEAQPDSNVKEFWVVRLPDEGGELRFTLLV